MAAIGQEDGNECLVRCECLVRMEYLLEVSKTFAPKRPSPTGTPVAPIDEDDGNE